MRPWWERHPDVLASERRVLELGGYSPKFEFASEEHAAEAEVAIEVSGSKWPAVARFPAEYPYFKPEVYCPGLRLTRHYHPFASNICLLPPSTRHWSVETTLAELLDEQLPDAIEIGLEPAGATAELRETRQGEPFSEYYGHLRGGAALLGRTNLPTSARFGRIEWVLLDEFPPRIAVLRIADRHGRTLFEAEKWLFEWAMGRELQGTWRRIDAPFDRDDPEAAFRAVGPFPKVRPGRASKLPPALHALVFPEEVTWHDTRDGFLFAFNGPMPRSEGARGGRRQERGVGFVRAQAIDTRDMLDRVPELEPLSGKHVLVVGLGMLGSHCALHLARSLVGRLTLVDFDYVEPSALVRWALGLRSAGKLKTDALAEHLREQYPFVEVEPIPYKLGSVPVDPVGRKRFLAALEGADLVLDAAAEIGVSNYLKDLCRDRGVPHVFVSGTPGGWGGQLGRSIPGRTGCWSCFKHFQNDGDIPVPNAAEGEVQPRGCANPTVTGAGFDMDQLACAAVRLAVSTLCAGEGAAYPDCDYDCLVADFRDEAGRHVAPDWRAYRLPLHPECPHDEKTGLVGSQVGEEAD